MSCEARIVRVLRTLEYPEAVDVDAAAAPSFLRRPAEMARMVAWIEDRKVMTVAALTTVLYLVCSIFLR